MATFSAFPNDFLKGCSGEVVLPQKRKMVATANNRMKAARALKGLTQLQVARLIGSKEIEISRIETGRARPDEMMKRRLVEVLGKPSFELFDC